MFILFHCLLVAPKVSVMEKILQVTLFVEKNILYPFTFLLGINYVAIYYNAKFGNLLVYMLIVCVCIICTCDTIYMCVHVHVCNYGVCVL